MHPGRNCLYCATYFEPKRRNQVYCCDNCRKYASSLRAAYAKLGADGVQKVIRNSKTETQGRPCTREELDWMTDAEYKEYLDEFAAKKQKPKGAAKGRKKKPKITAKTQPKKGVKITPKI